MQSAQALAGEGALGEAAATAPVPAAESTFVRDVTVEDTVEDTAEDAACKAAPRNLRPPDTGVLAVDGRATALALASALLAPRALLRLDLTRPAL